MKNKSKFYITTSIAYTNGPAHLGHAYEIILADAIARFKRLDGYDVFFLTGTDEHGLKIDKTAKKSGLSTPEFVDKIVSQFKHTYNLLNISHDKFIRTTSEEHKSAVAKIVNTLNEKGLIYKDNYSGYYCVSDEAYYTEFQAVNNRCPDCGKELEFVEEESYFFKMSEFQNFLEKLFNENPKFLVPEARRNEMINNFIKPGVEDLSISRTNFDWGIPIPFNEKHVLYVWMDALSNYITALGYGSDDQSLLEKYWPADLQIVGRDITRFHINIWPAMLHALGLEMPKQIQSHGFITVNGEKMSKSLGNGYSPDLFAELYGADALRYFYLKNGPLNYDTDFNIEVFLNTINSDIVNDLGNLVSRSTAMIEQYFNGIVPAPNNKIELDENLSNFAQSLINEFREYIEQNHVDLCLDRTFDLIRLVNKYIEDNQPWNLNKTDKERLKTVMYYVWESIRIVAVLLQNAMTEIPELIFEKLGIENEVHLKTFESVGTFNLENHGKKVNKGEALYKRLVVADEIKKINEIHQQNLKEQDLLLNNKQENKVD